MITARPRAVPQRRLAARPPANQWSDPMSKGMDRKKENKKKPAKTKDEKKAAKQEAKNAKRRGQGII
jgi:hypothetical protein